MASIQALDERIAALERELLAVKRQRNALVTALSLPSEVLADILRYTQHPDGLENAKLQTLGYDRKWVRIMLVCRVWRDVAVQTPVLWTIVDSGCTPWIELCDQRSSGMPLHLDGNSQRFKQQMSRAKSLNTVYAVDPDLDEDVIDLSAPAPRMEALRIITTAAFPGEVVIGQSFLQGTPSSLVHLELNGYGMRVERAPPMPSLCFLKLVRPLISVEFVAELGRQAPSLETLIFDHPSMSVLGTELTPRAQISLAKLRTLVVAGETPYVCALLQILPTPRSVFAVLAQPRSTVRVPPTEANVIYDACEAFLSGVPGQHAGVIRDNSTMAMITFGVASPPEQGCVHDWTPHNFSCFINNLLAPNFTHPFLARIETMQLLSWKALADGQSIINPDSWEPQSLPGLRILRLMHGRPKDVSPQVLDPIKLWLQSHGKIEHVLFVEWDPRAMKAFAEQLRREGIQSRMSYLIASGLVLIL
jgi:hypothetical protein